MDLIDNLNIPIQLGRTCKVCKEESVMEMWQADYEAWQNGAYIQDSAPYLSVDERELLISGICGSCFDCIFEGEDE
jgi:hypothetical protein